ncbi:MAG TPA: hypothetical protein DIW40_08445 [Halomonas sp.]|nr:hypothetical protein [Halomonas sp.]
MSALDNTALKIGSKYSFTHVNSVFSPIFALSCLRSSTVQTDPNIGCFVLKAKIDRGLTRIGCALVMAQTND